MSDEVLQLVALPEVVRTSGISKSEIFRRMKAGHFPQPVRMGAGRCTRWEMGEVQEWVRERLAERGAPTRQPEQRAG